MLTASCNFLDVVPKNTATLDDIFSTRAQAEKFVNNLYHYIPNHVAYKYTPNMAAGGDILTGPNGTTRWFPYKSILYGEENSNNSYYGFWEANTTTPTGRTNFDLYKGIRYAYTLIDNINSVPNITAQQANEMIGEAYFLIAFFHWTLMEYYGPVVIVEKEISINAPEDEVLLPRSHWDECIDFVARTFDKAAELLPPTRPRNELGRATSVAAKAYKARALVFSASAMVNGNPAYASFRNYDGSELMPREYDKEKWKRALDATLDAISLAEANGHKLWEDPASTGLPDAERGRNNHYKMFLERWNDTEYLFAWGDQGAQKYLQKDAAPRQWDATKEPYTKDGFTTYFVPTLQAVEAFLTEDGLPLWDDPKTKEEYAANRCLSVDDEGVAMLHRHRDPRFYATIGYDRGTYTYNGQTGVVLKMRQGEQHGLTKLTDEYNSCTGYVLQKFISTSTSYDPASKTCQYAEFAFPLLRLAELYLECAESYFEYYGKLDGEGLEAINKVRHRAGLPKFEESWALAGGMPTGDKMRAVLHQESMAELCCEARWYTNLRRWNIAEEILGECPDNLNIEGSTAEDFYRIVKMHESGIRVYDNPKNNWLAIPMAERDINFRLVQNPGY